MIVGSGAYRFEVSHNWLQLPAEYHWQTTHDVAVDQQGHIYVIHEGDPRLTDHPAIFVFAPDGTFLRAFGQQFQGGGHGLEIHVEDGEEFLYASAYLGLKFIEKLTPHGEVVWRRMAPIESGLYAEGEDTKPKNDWGRDRFHPTNFAFDPNGDVFVADGYGSYRIHRYQSNGTWQGMLGKDGTADGEFQLPHGLCVDHRKHPAQLVVTDRMNGRVQWLTLSGEHVRTMNRFLLPANADIHEGLLLIPDLQARVTLLDRDDQIVAQLGDDEAWRADVLADQMRMRTQPARWPAGKFIHPHDACFDREGNILVAEWVATGRITKLTRLA